MNLGEITKSIARNLGMLASDNSTLVEGLITRAGLLDEINRIYIEVIAQQLMNKSSADFTVEAKTNTYRQSFTVSAIDTVNKLITSTTGVFGRADVGAKIYNPIEQVFYTITSYISATQVGIAETPTSSWVADTAYILNNILILDGEMEDFKEILKFQIKYNSNDQAYKNAEKVTPTNFQDQTNQTSGNFSQTSYSISQIQENNVVKRCIKYYPYPTTHNGEIKLTYTQLPVKLVNDSDEPALKITGVADTIINGVTAWGFRLMDELAKSQIYEESNPNLGGVVPRGLTMVLKSYKPARTEFITYKGFRR